VNIEPNVFCNSPWFELHVYWNGDLGFCCQQNNTPYTLETSNPYNIKNMSIKDWYNSDPMKQARLRMFEKERWTNCHQCWKEEDTGATSRRDRSNQKSTIFKQKFEDSFNKSQNIELFTHSYYHNGETTQPPVDLHIDLGNYCNLACKMCWSGASSKIATQEKKWGTLVDENHLGNDWTKNEDVWNRFLNELLETPIYNLHFMGGETLIQPKFEELIDYLIENNKTDFGLSFVTNGTTFNQELILKLSKFSRLNIEVSIEALTDINSYVRQGTDTEVVLENIKKFQKYSQVTIRPAISALTIRDFHTLLDFCLQENLVVKALVVNGPPHLQVSVLPKDIRETYKEPYYKLITENIHSDINHSVSSNSQHLVSMYAQQAISLLDQEQTSGFEELIMHMKRWDPIYKYDAKKLYPELTEYLNEFKY